MTKIVLLKSRIPGRTFDDFRQNGYEVVDLVEVQGDVHIPKGLLDSLIHTAKVKALKTKAD